MSKAEMLPKGLFLNFIYECARLFKEKKLSALTSLQEDHLSDEQKTGGEYENPATKKR
ncbi:MAG: hypothetical protein O3C13_09395 [Bacteroidetes bacterium]|nr:hypothetical protein [Bacteroidota bacterium]